MSKIEKRTWKEFVDSGLLWWVNRTLHLFGWALAYELDEDKNITFVYPARCKYRGFVDEGKSFRALTEHIKEQLPNMLEDVEN